MSPLFFYAQIVMYRISPITRAWVSAVWRPFWVACFVLTIIASLLLTAQLVLRAPIVPTPLGLVRVWCAMLPETIGILAPAALLLAVVITGRKWMDSGDMAALHASGCGPIPLLRPTLVMGVVVACAVAACAQLLGPMGRTVAHNTIASAADSYRIRSGHMVELGTFWVRAGQRSGSDLKDVVVVSDEWMAWAPVAHRNQGGGIRLVDGVARGVGAEWSITFESASIAIQSARGQVHNFARSQDSLRELIKRMEVNGKNPARERLALYKRTTLPLVTPLLALLGLPLGTTRRRPYLTAVVFVLGLWALQRVGDHGALHWGPEVVAGLPLVVVSAITLVSWLRWLR